MPFRKDLVLDDFSPNLGEPYEAGVQGEEITLVLEEATALPPSAREGGSFRLVFRGPHEPILPQAIHPLRRGEASFDIFIVPLQPDRSGVPYEAIFN